MAKIAPQEYRMVAVSDLEPHPDNPHQGDVDVIVASIKKHGFYGSVVAQQSRMRIVAGEHRWRGAAKAGLKHVPTVIIDVDDETAQRIMLADNRLAEYGQYDDAKLAELLQSLPDLDGTGWRDEDLSDLLDDLGDIEIVHDELATSRPAPTPAPSAPESVGEDPDDEDDSFGIEDDEPTDEHDQDAHDESANSAAPPPRPKAGAMVELIVPLTAAQHDEVTGLVAEIRSRDGDASLADVVMAALRSHAERQR